MQYYYLGRTGVRVSAATLGTMTFGNEADEATSFAIMDHAAESGINHFDTANIYNGGKSEEITGRWLKDKRDDFVLATKVYFPAGAGVNDRGSSRRHLVQSVEASLRRLATDHVDILYLHHWDENTSIEESLAAVSDLVLQGKVHYLGVSNFSAWQVQLAIQCAWAHGFVSPVCIQPMYNLLKRTAEIEIFPQAVHHDIAVFPYSPMGAGMLSGKYLRGESGRIDESAMYAERYRGDIYANVSRGFIELAQELGESPAALAVAWCAAHPAVTAPIIGARNMDQLTDTMRFLEIDMNDDLHDRISALTPPVPLATDREPMGATLAQVTSGSHTAAKK